MDKFTPQYLELVKGELASLNLTRILDEEEFHQKQYLDSLLPFNKIKKFKELIDEHEVVVDLGCGGGFPLLPLAFNYPDNIFIGIDARAKKMNAVNLIAERIGLDNVRANHARFEKLNFDIPVMITVKAVGKIKEILRSLTLSEESYALFYKGPSVRDQEDVPEHTGGWRLVQEEKIVFGEYTRTYFLYRFVPRGTSKIKKNLVNLTDLL